jgi:hypothetical protein
VLVNEQKPAKLKVCARQSFSAQAAEIPSLLKTAKAGAASVVVVHKTKRLGQPADVTPIIETQEIRRVIIGRGAAMASNIVGLVFLGLGASSAVVGSVLVHREIIAVNRKVSDAEHISLSYMYPGKMQKIKAEYKRLYPTGKS